MKSSASPDPKFGRRVRDPGLLRRLHGEWRECALCGETNVLSLHHILKRPKDDLEANLIMVCGDGVRGCHGLLEAHDGPTVRQLGHYLLNYRPDTLDYLIAIMGREAATDWLERQMS